MNIVILSQNPDLYSTNAIVQAAIKRKHNVRVINPIGCDIFMEQGNPEIFYRRQKLTHIDAVIPRIGSSITYYGIALIRQFELMGIFTTTSSLALTQSRDKLQSLQLFTSHNLPIPKTAFTNPYRSPEETIRLVGGAPLIIKVLEGTQGIGVVLAENNHTAEAMLDAFNGLQTKIITQQYIEESKGEDLRIIVINNKVISAMKRKGKKGDFRSNLHRGGTSEVAILTPKEKEIAIEAAKALNLKIAGVDLLQSHNGPLILEVNSSPGLEGIETTTKTDIAKAIIKFVENSNL